MSTDYYSKKIEFDYKSTSYVLDRLDVFDGKTSYNLVKIFERSKGKIFQVNEEGELQVVSGWKQRRLYLKNRKANEAKVKVVIDQALMQLNEYLSRLGDEKVAEAAVKYLFSKNGQYGIGRLGKALYNHKLLKSDTIFSKYLLPKNTMRLKLSDHKFANIASSKFEGKNLPWLLEMHLGNETLDHNLWMLLKRKKGQIYQVNGKGELEKVKRKFIYKLHKTEHEKKVNEVVTEVITKLNAYWESKTTLTEVDRLVMDRIFSPTSPLCRMSRNTFNRGVIQEGSFIEKTLKSDLGEKREELCKALKELRDASEPSAKKNAKLHVEAAFLDLAFVEFEFAQKLGIDLKLVGSGGSGGARFAYDRFGHKILVVKAEDEGPLGVNNPKWYARLKRWLISPKACLEGNAETMAEISSRLWDRKFDIWTVPPTEIRHVRSGNFKGDIRKQCSVQAYVDKCQTLGEYVGISPKIQWLPRTLLRWFLGNRDDTGIFYTLGQKETKKAVLLQKLPLHALERVAIQNMGVEDIDCHFENILVKVSDPPEKTAILHRLFAGDASVTDEEIQNFVGNFFQFRGNQELLTNLLHSEKITVGGVEKYITLVKHDGGASHPHDHPRWWDFLSLRFKHLFEVLPHFEEMFTPEGKKLIENKEEVFASYLLELALWNLRGILTSKVFERFYSFEECRSIFKRWVFETNPEAEYHLRLKLVAELFKATGERSKEGPYVQYYFNHHLKRIRGNLDSRRDSFRILAAYVARTDKNMRAVFKDVRTANDFDRELQALNDGCFDALKKCQARDVKKGNFLSEEFRELSSNFLFEGLGEPVS